MMTTMREDQSGTMLSGEGAVLPGEPEWEAALPGYRSRAVRALLAHQAAADGRCEVCGEAMPCASACNAELILEL